MQKTLRLVKSEKDVYIKAFAYAGTANKKRGYQDQEAEQRSVNCYRDEK